MIDSPFEEEFETYGFEYKYRGSIWCMDIKAESYEDAKNRINAMQNRESPDIN